MMLKIKKCTKKVLFLVRTYRVWLIATAFLLLVSLIALLVVSYRLISPYQQYVLASSTDPKLLSLHEPVGLVLGAGVNNDGKPYRELQARLDAAAQALETGSVRKLILSGDNRFLSYNEPQAMLNYLVSTKHVSPDKLQVDYAGRSTYESCDRAAHVFGLTGAPLVIFSAGSHLPRAIYLCRHFGIQAYGISSNVEANNSTRRELLARVKAVFNVYIYGEKTILGEPIAL